jgi:hypothetical protein
VTLITKLPSGKLINLSLFVALLPDEGTTGNSYKLSLSGKSGDINIDSFDANFIENTLKSHNFSHREEYNQKPQLPENPSLINLINQWKKSQNTRLPIT